MNYLMQIQDTAIARLKAVRPRTLTDSGARYNRQVSAIRKWYMAYLQRLGFRESVRKTTWIDVQDMAKLEKECDE